MKMTNNLTNYIRIEFHKRNKFFILIAFIMNGTVLENQRCTSTEYITPWATVCAMLALYLVALFWFFKRIFSIFLFFLMIFMITNYLKQKYNYPSFISF